MLCISKYNKQLKTSLIIYYVTHDNSETTLHPPIKTVPSHG